MTDSSVTCRMIVSDGPLCAGSHQILNLAIDPSADPSLFILEKNSATADAKQDATTNTTTHNRLLQVFRFKEKVGSWFVSDDVIQDGSLFLLVEVDPLFILLHALLTVRNKTNKNQQGYFCQVDHILGHDTGLQLLHDANLDIEWEAICDKQDGPSYRFNESRFKIWLRFKIDAIAQALKHNQIQPISTAVSQSKQLKSSSSGSTGSSFTTGDFRKYACGIIEAYIPQELHEILNQVGRELGVPLSAETTVLRHKRSAEESEGVSVARHSGAEEQESEAGSSKSEAPRAKRVAPSKAAQLAKADPIRGQRSIAAFWKSK